MRSLWGAEWAKRLPHTPEGRDLVRVHKAARRVRDADQSMPLVAIALLVAKVDDDQISVTAPRRPGDAVIACGARQGAGLSLNKWRGKRATGDAAGGAALQARAHIEPISVEWDVGSSLRTVVYAGSRPVATRCPCGQGQNGRQHRCGGGAKVDGLACR